jgi:uncharacterized protein (TIGR02118 family)
VTPEPSRYGAYPLTFGWNKLDVPARDRAKSKQRFREETVVKVSVFYPNSAGCKFDMNYYLAKHMPMVQQKLGAACKSIAVEQGIAGGAPGAPATYVAMGHLYFDSADAFQAAFAPHAQAILADIPNYTNTQPTIQISDVKA